MSIGGYPSYVAYSWWDFARRLAQWWSEQLTVPDDESPTHTFGFEARWLEPGPDGINVLVWGSWDATRAADTDPWTVTGDMTYMPMPWFRGQPLTSYLIDRPQNWQIQTYSSVGPEVYAYWRHSVAPGVALMLSRLVGVSVALVYDPIDVYGDTMDRWFFTTGTGEIIIAFVAMAPTHGFSWATTVPIEAIGVDLAVTGSGDVDNIELDPIILDPAAIGSGGGGGGGGGSSDLTPLIEAIDRVVDAIDDVEANVSVDHGKFTVAVRGAASGGTGSDH